MTGWIRYAVAFVIAVHGLVYLNAARGVLPVFEGWKGTSWLLGAAVSGDALKRLSTALWGIAGAGLLATAAAIAFAPSAATVWRPTAIVASAVGIVSFLVFWDGRPDRLVAEGAVGLAVSAALLAAAIAFPAALTGAT